MTKKYLKWVDSSERLPKEGDFILFKRGKSLHKGVVKMCGEEFIQLSKMWIWRKMKGERLENFIEKPEGDMAKLWKGTRWEMYAGGEKLPIGSEYIVVGWPQINYIEEYLDKNVLVYGFKGRKLVNFKGKYTGPELVKDSFVFKLRKQIVPVHFEELIHIRRTFMGL
ncbi:MAG: hypothetical protein QF775_01360 [archaeon]|jgi:hypothetical protein|nr:hypothetical protein [Euryarchaeota archaeon]MDP6704114.1 hypothetical protein [archaeon]HIK01444.1 hypothetical protein [Candidatus Undinarchaeales archaeon ERR594346 U_76725]|tara:strand:- start:23137 stop:23637 length:501 start_codon:yes stop_codon:yes gene_type:complete